MTKVSDVVLLKENTDLAIIIIFFYLKVRTRSVSVNETIYCNMTHIFQFYFKSKCQNFQFLIQPLTL